MKLLNSRNYGERKCRGNRQKNWLVWLFRYATVEKMLWLWFSFICMLGAMKLEDCTPLDFSSFSLVYSIRIHRHKIPTYMYKH